MRTIGLFRLRVDGCAMTHDDLLEKIKKYTKGAGLLDSRAWAAVKAVANTHHAYQESEDGPFLCAECTAISRRRQIYPCPTIEDLADQLP